MSSEKMSLENFKAALGEGRYTSRTGALRAVGRSSMSDAEKERCQKIAVAHFGEEAPAKSAPRVPPGVTDKAPKKGSKKASKKVTKKVTKKTSKRTTKKSAKADPDPASAESSGEGSAPPPGFKGKKKTSKKGRRSSGTTSRSEVRSNVDSILAQQTNEPADAYLERMGRVVKTSRDGIEALEYAKRQDPTIAIGDGVKAASSAITGSMTGLSVFAQQLARGSSAHPVLVSTAEAPEAVSEQPLA